MIQKEAGFFCRTSSSVRLWWEFKEPKGPRGLSAIRKDAGLCCGSRLRSGEVFAFVGSIQNLKDLEEYAGSSKNLKDIKDFGSWKNLKDLNDLTRVGML